jgi:2-C-methyl-D-erythritol 4-phosphate cytidylyltransferase
MKTTAVIVAAGSATRFGGTIPKQFAEVCGRPLLAWTISRFEQARSIDEVIVVAAEDQLAYVSDKVVDPYGFAKVTRLVSAGLPARSRC